MKTHGRIRDLVKPIQQAHQFVDVFTAEILRNEGERIPCKKGCAACCYQFSALSIPEALFIISEMLQKPHLNLWWESKKPTLFGQYNLMLKLSSNEDTKEFQLLRAAWWSKQIPCLFLQNDNTCIIYPFRPATCKGYFIVGEDASHCSGPTLQKVFYTDVRPIVEMVAKASAVVAKELRIPPAVVQPMPNALVSALIGMEEGIGVLRRLINEALKKGETA
jgi:Fe-S-cluster containining protein